MHRTASRISALLLLCNLFCGSGIVQAYTPDTLARPLIVGLKTHTGFIIPHAEEVRGISNSRPWGIQADFSRHYNTQQIWDQCSCYPRIGVSLAYFNFDNPEILGSSYNASLYIEPYIRHRGRLNASFRLSGGVSILDNIYHPEQNPLNFFYSTPVSFLLQASMSVHYRLTEKWSLNASGHYNHISNGGIRLPNKGINFPTAGLGVDYAFGPVNLPERNSRKSVNELHPQRWKIGISPFVARRRITVEEPPFYVFGLNATGTYIATRMSGLSIGAEWVYDSSVRTKRDRDQPENRENYAPMHMALLAGHDLIMGRFTFSQHLGIHLQKPEQDHERLFQRWGLSYRLSEKLTTGLNLKAYRNVAIFLDARATFRLY